MGLIKHAIYKSVDTHFDKQVAANVGVNATNRQIQQTQPTYMTANGQQIANPKLYANWQARKAQEERQKVQNYNARNAMSETMKIKKAELITELIKDGKTPEEALEFADRIF